MGRGEERREPERGRQIKEREANAGASGVQPA